MLGKLIYKRDSKGALRFWQFEVQDDRWCSHAGLVGGERVTSGWTTCTPKSRPTAEEQAVFEAEAEMGKKLAKDYALTIEGVDDERDAGGKPMLAEKFVSWPGPCFSQPKLDGMRCKANRHGLWSRTGKRILSCPHIEAILAPRFVTHTEGELDGELYAHEMKADFPQLMSILRKSKPTDEDIAKAATYVKFHLYDTYQPGMKFGERSKALELFVTTLDVPEIVFVPTTPVHDATELDAAYAAYLEDGYEGQMVRLDGLYERKRSKLLLKRKEFEEREFELVAIEEGNGNWAGLAKRVTFKLPDGRLCGAGIKGNAEQAKELLGRAPTLIGKPVTVRYFPPPSGPGADTLPRFPVATVFNRPDHVQEAA